jgi:hypothetical protein
MIPVVCPESLRETLSWMLVELDESGLRVELIPAPERRHEGHQVRVAVDRNPQWYRDLCAMFPRHRRRRGDRYTDSTVKRADVRRCIELLLGRGTASQFAKPLLGLAEAEDERLRRVAA